MNTIYIIKNTVNDKVYIGQTCKLIDGKRVCMEKLC